MIGDGRAHAGADVGRRAQLERDAPVAHVGGEAAEVLMAGWSAEVVDDADAVAQPFGTAPLQRLPDRRQAERLAGVDRGVEVLALHVLEGVEVSRRWVAGFGAGDVEADDARVAP